jgi:hypothetical protein
MIEDFLDAEPEPQPYVDRAKYPLHFWLDKSTPMDAFSSPAEEHEYWRKTAWEGFAWKIRDTERRAMAGACRKEHLLYAMTGLSYDLAVVKANEILDRGLRGDAAIRAFRDEFTDALGEIEAAWHTSRERLAVYVDDEQRSIRTPKQAFHEVQHELRLLLNNLPASNGTNPIAANHAEAGPDGIGLVSPDQDEPDIYSEKGDREKAVEDYRVAWALNTITAVAELVVPGKRKKKYKALNEWINKRAFGSDKAHSGVREHIEIALRERPRPNQTTPTS